MKFHNDWKFILILLNLAMFQTVTSLAMAISVNPDQTAPDGAVWPELTLFARMHV